MHVTWVVIILMVIGATLWLAEKMAKAGWVPLVLARKLVHVVAIGAVAISPVLFTNLWLLGGLVGAFVLLLFWAVATERLAIDGRRNRKSWGIVLFPLAFLLLLVAFGREKPWLVIYPMLILALADAAAAVAGELVAKKYFTLTGDRKSAVGSLAFFGVSFAVLYLLPGWLSRWHPLFSWPALPVENGQVFWMLFMVAVFCTLAEVLGSGGADNISVPLVAAWAMEIVVAPNGLFLLAQAYAAVALFVVLARWLKWLDWGGALLAGWLGVVVWVSGQWWLALPMLVFFVSGSLLGKLPRHTLSDAKHQRPRDWQQVFANGGIGGLLLMFSVFFPAAGWWWGFWLSVAIATADTWSSEIGQWCGGRVVDLATGKPLQAGLSGGVSWQGTVGGLAGAITIGVLGWLCSAYGWQQMVAVVLGGFAGMLVDSLLGSRWQAKYKSVDGQTTENQEASDGKPPFWGLHWMTNDWVNLLSNAGVVVIVWIVWLLVMG